jgi:hypothetical protein
MHCGGRDDRLAGHATSQRMRESFENPEKIKWSDQAKAPLEVRLFGLFKLVASFARYRRVEA